MRIQRFYIIVTFPRQNNVESPAESFRLSFSQSTLPFVFSLMKRKMSSVMHHAQVIRRQILPCPVKSRQLAVARVLERNIIACVVAAVPYTRLSRASHMQRNIHRRVRHTVSLMRIYNYFYICHRSRSHTAASSQVNLIYAVLQTFVRKKLAKYSYYITISRIFQLFFQRFHTTFTIPISAQAPKDPFLSSPRRDAHSLTVYGYRALLLLQYSMRQEGIP